MTYEALCYELATTPGHREGVLGRYSPSAHPTECSHHGGVKVGPGRPCHRCECILMLDAAITANVKAGRTARALAQLRLRGI